MKILTFCYHLAVSCWLGGAALFTFLLTPILFRVYARDLAGGIVGALLPAYFRWGLACGVVALMCRIVLRGRFAVVSCLLIGLMLATVAGQAFVVEPRATAIKQEIGSFEATPLDHPRRIRFRKLHAVSMAANLAVIVGGAVLVLLASISVTGQSGRRDEQEAASKAAEV